MIAKHFSRGFAVETVFAATLGLSFLAACSGGGENGSGPNSPVLNVRIDSTTVDEGQPIVIDATNSVDPTGSGLSFSVTQTAGPAVGPAPEDLVLPAVDGIVAFSAPELSADDTLEFTVTAKNQQEQTQERYLVRVQNIDLQPRSSLYSGPAMVSLETFSLGGGSERVLIDEPKGDFVLSGNSRDGRSLSERRHILDRNPGPTDTLAMTVINRNGSGTLEDFRVNDLGLDVDVSLAFDWGRFASPNDYEEEGLAVASEEQDELSVFLSEWTPDFDLRSTISVSKPCAVFAGPLIREASSSSAPIAYDDILVGSRGGGLMAFQNDGNRPGATVNDHGKFTASPQVLSPDGEYCFVDESLEQTNLGYVRKNIFGFDFESRELTRWSAYGTSNFAIEEGPFAVDIEDGLEVVRATKKTLISRDGLLGEVFAVIASDGQHDGRHQAVIYFWRPGQQLDQGVRHSFTWSKGIPSDLHFTDTGTAEPAFGSPHLHVALSSAPFVAIISNTSNLEAGEDLAFQGVEYAEAELGMERVIRTGYTVPSKDKVIAFE